MASPKSAPGAPRWVKVSALVACVVIAIVVVMLLVGGDHGPGRHLGGDGAGAPEGHTGPPPGVEHSP